MHFAKNKDKTSLSQTYIVHNNQQIVFKCKTYQPVKLKQPDQLFDPINGFLSTLSQVEQDSIFQCYTKIARTLDKSTSGYTNAMRLDAVTLYMQELFSIINADDILTYINNYENNIYIPDDLPEDCGAYVPDKTYLKSDYPAFVAFVITVQFAMPVWGDITDMLRHEESNVHKEMYMWSMLRDTTVIEQEGCQRFIRLVNVLTENVDAPLSIITQGIGSFDLPRWMLSMAVLRKLAIAELTCDKTKIINNVFSYVTDKITKLPSFAKNVYHDKLAVAKSVSNRRDLEGEKKALMEEYKPKTVIRMAVPIENKVYASNPKVVCNNLLASEGLMEFEDTETVTQLYKQALKNIRFLNRLKPSEKAEDISTFAKAICTKLFQTQVTPNQIMESDEKTWYTYIGIAQAWLVERGWTHLAVQMTAIEEVYDDNLQIRTNLTLTKDLESQLLESFYFRRQARRDVNNRNTNIGLKDVHEVMNTVTGSYWVCNVRPDYLKLIGKEQNLDPIVLSPELKKDYAKFILKTLTLKYCEV